MVDDPQRDPSGEEPQIDAAVEQEAPDVTIEELLPTRRSPQRMGRYELYIELGKGGMASVHLGRLIGEKGFERWVAIKRMHEHLADDREFRTMFLDEAKMAARVQHPNVVQVTDFGIEEERPYLVMEYVNGETMAALLVRCQRIGRPLPRPIAARIVAWACEGLHHAHELRSPTGEPQGLVHRDVSPHNILVSSDGVVKVSDFGIAKAVDSSTHTRTGRLKGKSAYMSPEQVLAQPLDRRSDLFSLGIVLFEATVSRRLFKRTSELETLQAITSGEVRTPRSFDSSYPSSLEHVVLRALQRRPDDRYQTAREMQRDLEQYLAKVGEPVGTAELGELMARVFEDRLRARTQLLASALATDVTAEPTAVKDPGPTTLSFTTPPRRVGSKRLIWALAVLLAVAFAAAGVATYLAASAMRARRAAPTTAGLRATDGRVRSDGDASGGPADATRRADAEPGAVGPRVPADAQGDGEGQPEGGPDQGRTVRTKAKVGMRPSTLPEPGTLSVMASPWCEVYLDGRRLGRTPIMGVSVPAGRHVLRLLPRGEEPGVRRTVQVRPGRETPISFDDAPPP